MVHGDGAEKNYKIRYAHPAILGKLDHSRNTANNEQGKINDNDQDDGNIIELLIIILGYIQQKNIMNVIMHQIWWFK